MQWLKLMANAMEASSDIIRRNISQDLFSVFNMLGVRWISHHQAIFDLLMYGYYGETTALHRMLLEVTDRITYFGLYPEDATPWRQWSAQDPTNNSKQYKIGLRRFSQTHIMTKIKEKGTTPICIDYQKLSAAIHPNEWGTHYYIQAPINDKKDNLLHFSPRFDARVAFRLGILANRTLSSPIYAFLLMCHQGHAPKSVWRPIENHYKEYLPYWEQSMKFDSEFDAIIDETEKRVQAGESLEKVQVEIFDRYNIPLTNINKKSD